MASRAAEDRARRSTVQRAHQHRLLATRSRRGGSRASHRRPLPRGQRRPLNGSADQRRVVNRRRAHVSSTREPVPVVGARASRSAASSHVGRGGATLRLGEGGFVDTEGAEGWRRGQAACPLQLAAALALIAAALTGAVVWLNVDGRTEPQAQTVPRLPAGSPDAEDARLASLHKSLAATTAHPSHAPLKQQRPTATKRSQHRPVHRSAPRPARPASPVHPSAAAHPVSTQSMPSSTSSVSSTPSTPVSSSTPSQSVDVPSSSSTGSVVSEPTQPTSSSTTSGGSATSSHSGGQSSKAKAPAGPTGNSALLGPGHCNC